MPLLNQKARNVFPARPIRADRARRTAGQGRARGRRRSADAVAVRSVSLSVDVRDGAVEESQRSEGDDLGLRVLVGRKQAVVSTNDMSGDGVDALAERAVAMARVAPEDQFAGLADPGAAGAEFPRPRPGRSAICRTSPRSKRMARAAEEAGLRGQGRQQIGRRSASAGIGGMVLVTSHGFHGAYLGSRHGVVDDRRSPAKAPAWSATTISPRRCTPPISTRRRRSAGRAGERAVARLNPRKVATRKVPVVFDPRSPARSSAIWPAPSTAPRSRARPAS